MVKKFLITAALLLWPTLASAQPFGNPLPVGAAIAAKQPALGTAGTPSADVITVQGATNGLPQNVYVVPAISGGLVPFHLVAAASVNATNIKASPGQVCGWYIYNSNAAARKVVFHNTAGTPTAGAGVYFTINVPPLSGANAFSSHCIAFSTGIAITTVTGVADTDATAVGVNDLGINLFTK